jgi:hypothetical protein
MRAVGAIEVAACPDRELNRVVWNKNVLHILQESSTIESWRANRWRCTAINKEFPAKLQFFGYAVILQCINNAEAKLVSNVVASLSAKRDQIPKKKLVFSGIGDDARD